MVAIKISSVLHGSWLFSAPEVERDQLATIVVLCSACAERSVALHPETYTMRATLATWSQINPIDRALGGRTRRQFSGGPARLADERKFIDL
jgi:hypothetical protein